MSQQPVHLAEVALRWPRRLQDGGRREKLPGDRCKTQCPSALVMHELLHHKVVVVFGLMLMLLNKQKKSFQ